MTNAAKILETDPLDGLLHLRSVAKRGHEILATRDEEEAVDWFWEGRVACDNHVEISGPSYSGKTTLALMLAVAAANPGAEPVRVLGADIRPNPEGTFSVVVEEENAQRSCAEVLAACCGMLNLPLDETLARVLLVARADVIAHGVTRETRRSSIWADIVELGQRGKVGLLIIDSRARVLCGGRDGAMAGDSDSGDEQAFAQRVIHQAIKACGCPVCVVSHTRKTSGGAPLTLEDVAGSHQRAAGADVVLLVSAERSQGRIQRSRVVFGKIRDSIDEHPEPRTFAIMKNGGAWKLETEEAGTGRQPHERVLDLLASSKGETMTSNQIREALGLSGEAVRDAISALLTTRKIAKVDTMVNGRKRVAFRARADTSDVFADADEVRAESVARRKGGRG